MSEEPERSERLKAAIEEIAGGPLLCADCGDASVNNVHEDRQVAELGEVAELGHKDRLNYLPGAPIAFCETCNRKVHLNVRRDGLLVSGEVIVYEDAIGGRLSCPKCKNFSIAKLFWTVGLSLQISAFLHFCAGLCARCDQEVSFLIERKKDFVKPTNSRGSVYERTF